MRQSCDVEFDPIAIEGHWQVGGSAWATCQDGHLPSRHHMVLWMQFQRLADRGTSHWLDVASADTDQIPRDALTRAGHPVTVIVHAPCQQGVFRMQVTVDGTMPDTGDWIPYTRTSEAYTVSDPAKCDR